ncbi:hypothetical protein PVAP13_5NG615302 [Panicum virgatum]|uniref:Uncharacterized protein n=1 Tax=Panicum virgatum TaxID=38727 RepID=A0A8T0S4U3_PANVG|nr:hypothetical protein PVAP13_5NG615302 [Panicum virgatum]
MVFKKLFKISQLLLIQPWYLSLVQFYLSLDKVLQ